MENNKYSVDEKIIVLKNRVVKLDKMLNNDSLGRRFGLIGTYDDTIKNLVDSIESLVSEIKIDINTIYEEQQQE